MDNLGPWSVHRLHSCLCLCFRLLHTYFGLSKNEELYICELQLRTLATLYILQKKDDKCIITTNHIQTAMDYTGYYTITY